MNSREERFRSASLDSSRRLVLELHEFKVARDKIKAADVGLADHFGDRNRIVIANGIIEGSALHEVEFWLDSVKSRKRCLGVEIDRKNPVPLERQALSEVSRCRRFAGPALEVHH